MSKSDYTAVGRLLLRIYVLEVGLAVIAFGLYKTTAFATALLVSKSGVLLLAGLVIAALGAGPLVGALVRSRRSLGLAIAANVLSILLAVLVGESALRLAVRSSPDGITVAGVPLRPTWSDLVAQIHAMPPATQSFFLYDAELGWTVGPGRAPPPNQGGGAISAPGEAAGYEVRRLALTPPADAPTSEPYFLQRPRAGAQYDWSVAPESLRGEPFELAMDPGDGLEL